MIVGKKLTIEMYYYSVNNNGLHFIMMGDNGNPTLQIKDKVVSGNIHLVTYTGIIESGWRQLNIYGQGNSNFEIYIFSINSNCSIQHTVYFKIYLLIYHESPLKQ